MLPTPPPSNPPAAPDKARWPKWSRRAALAALAFLVLLAAGFFLLPLWISNEQGRLYSLDRLNDRLHGPRLAVDSWTLGWFRATELKNLRLLAPDGATILSCPRVSTGLTLWDVFWGNYDFHNTTADRLELRLARNADGTTSLDSFGGIADILRSARGALQVNNGQITIYSARTGQTLRYSDAKATITIASADAPFHVQFAALGAPDASLALTATFPPLRTLSAPSLVHPGVWTLLTEFDFTANRVPTGLACDYLGVDGTWADSFGPTLDTVHFTGRPPAATTLPLKTQLELLVRGAAPGPDVPAIDARLLLLLPPAPQSTGGSLTTAAPGGDYYVNAALLPSPPLARLLGRVNPLLGEISPTPLGLVRASANALTLPLDHPENSEAAFRLTFPPLAFVAHNGPSLLRQLQVTFGDVPRPTTRVDGAADALRVTLSARQFHYENFLVSLASRRINFTGNVALDGKLDLSARIPDLNSGLAASATKVVITGTTDAPLLKRAE
jgi:hypothetical protein